MGQRACDLQALSAKSRMCIIIYHPRGCMRSLRCIASSSLISLTSSYDSALAVVYHGKLNSKTPVAIKVYTPTTATEDTVADFSHEAALCGALNHPNAVKFYGMCVNPPTISLVSELCQGSLDVVTAAQATQTSDSRRQQFPINLGRDIQPSNFVVDSSGTVKLTVFGESRFLSKMNSKDLDSPEQTYNSGTSPGSTPKDDQSYVNFENAKQDESKVNPSLSRLHDCRLPATSIKMTIKRTADYMAPEMINGKGGFAAYDEAADVYSLAITMWDILYPEKEKYPNSNNNHLRVFETVIAGTRPEVDSTLHPGLGDLLASAIAIVHILERIQEEICSTFGLKLRKELDKDIELVKVDESTVVSQSGEKGVRKLTGTRAVSCVSEGVSLGNILADAGFLHHTKHSRSFEFGTSMYLFDGDTIRLCQPFGMLEGNQHHGSDLGTTASIGTSPIKHSPH